MKIIKSLVVGVLVAMSASLYADFTYTETTQVTGGSVMSLMKMAGAFSRQARQMGAPVVSTVTIKGNRMARINPDRTEIIDLDAETITNIDMLKREYTVMTFEQMKQQMEAAQARVQAQQQKSAQAPAAQPSNTEIKFQVHVRNTGQSKDVVGLSANESILVMNVDATDTTSGQAASMAITNDMWLVPEVPGYGEVKEFYRKYALKMGAVFGGAVSPAMVAQYRGAGLGMADLAKEMSKLNGTPVLQVMRMGMTTNGQPLPAASEAPLPAADAAPATPSAGDVAQQSASSTIARKLGALGGFGGFGPKKQADPAPAADDSGSAAPPDYSVLIETNTQLASFSRTADEGSFAIPAGFKQVQMKGVN